MGIMSVDEFEPRTVDKVDRLLDLLEEMERHPALKGSPLKTREPAQDAGRRLSLAQWA